MKKYFFLALMLLTLSFGCKKDEEPQVDPRDQFVGTYSAETVLSVPSLDFYESANGTNVISKETAAGRIKITDDTGFACYANVSGNSYVYEKYSLTENVDGVTITQEMTGSGVINGTTINETGVLKISAFGQTFTGTWTSTLVKQ